MVLGPRRRTKAPWRPHGRCQYVLQPHPGGVNFGFAASRGISGHEPDYTTFKVATRAGGETIFRNTRSSENAIRCAVLLFFSLGCENNQNGQGGRGTGGPFARGDEVAKKILAASPSSRLREKSK